MDTGVQLDTYRQADTVHINDAGMKPLKEPEFNAG